MDRALTEIIEPAQGLATVCAVMNVPSLYSRGIRSRPLVWNTERTAHLSFRSQRSLRANWRASNRGIESAEGALAPLQLSDQFLRDALRGIASEVAVI